MKMIKKIRVQHVHYMPKELEPGILYVSEEFGTAAHLCACGCGAKIRTPLGPTDWTLKETKKGPTLRPSVGNWQQNCQSHYWICQGEIRWADEWTPEQIALGRRREEERNRIYYNDPGSKNDSILRRLWHWVKSLIEKG